MLKTAKATIGSLAVAAMIAGGAVAAAPAAQAEPGFYGAQVHEVGNRNWRGGRNWNKNWNRNWSRNHWDNRRYNNNQWVGPVIGLGAGILLGSALAAPRYSAPPVRYYGGNRDAYCSQKYRSYNPRTGTYTGYDGRQHYCRIP